MTPDEEFYSLISKSFTPNQIETIKAIIVEKEGKLREFCNKYSRNLETELKPFYYNLCSLFYSSAKNYNNFKLNLASSLLSLEYISTIVYAEDEKTRKAMQYYDSIHNTITRFVNESEIFQAVDNLESLAYALTNAVVPELLSQKDSCEKLNCYQDNVKIQQLASAIKEGKKISHISFFFKNQKFADLCCSTVINNFWEDLIKFSSYRLKMPDNIDAEIEELENQVKYSINRITLRICMVLVHYRIFTKTTSSEKYIQ